MLKSVENIGQQKPYPQTNDALQDTKDVPQRNGGITVSGSRAEAAGAAGGGRECILPSSAMQISSCSASGNKAGNWQFAAGGAGLLKAPALCSATKVAWHARAYQKLNQ